MSVDPRALAELTNNQRQLDVDGVMVGVSRQALDEVLADYQSLAARLTALSAENAELVGQLHILANELSWNPKTRSLSERIRSIISGEEGK